MRYVINNPQKEKHMLTFYSDPAKKQARIERHRQHAEQDRLIAGRYQDGKSNRGCSVGCDAIDITGKADSNCHGIVAFHDGLPEWLEHLRDIIFEGLPSKERKAWHVDLTEAIPVGVDIEKVLHQLADWILSPDGPMPDSVSHQIVAKAIAQVRKYHQDMVSGTSDSESARAAARLTATFAVADSSRSEGASVRLAANSAAASVVESAAASVTESVRLAANSAIASGRLKAFSSIASTVIDLLKKVS